MLENNDFDPEERANLRISNHTKRQMLDLIQFFNKYEDDPDVPDYDESKIIRISVQRTWDDLIGQKKYRPKL